MQAALRQANLHLIDSAGGPLLFVADGSRLYEIGEEDAAQIRAWLTGENSEAAARLAEALLGGRKPYISQHAIQPPPVTSLSLNLAQVCNLRCAYCYADFGRFGADPRLMEITVAEAAVNRLLLESPPYSSPVLGFMGGEPLLHRELLQRITEYAVERAAGSGCRIRLSVTTNGTLLNESDAELFSKHQFHVTVSLDGDRDTHNRLRVLNSGPGSYDLAIRGIERLTKWRRPRHLSARVTVTSRTGPLLPLLDHLIGLGFDSVGMTPVLSSPDPSLALGTRDFGPLLASMIECGEKAVAELRARRRYPFANLENALTEIHRGTHRPYPCGAGAGYLSVSADGELYACHRLIEDRNWAMGNVFDGPERLARSKHLTQHHVDRAEPCRGCWARYLCGGGCHHEVARVGRPSCDYIRGWLEFCIRAYAELSTEVPEYFASPPTFFEGAIQ